MFAAVLLSPSTSAGWTGLSDSLSCRGRQALTGTLVVLGNIGPGFGELGPMGGFEALPVPSKLFMCLLMVAGRLEVMTALVVLAPSYWKG